MAVMQKMLNGFAIASLVLCALVLVFWWRSYGHVDHLNLGKLTGEQTELTSTHGVLTVTTVRDDAGMIHRQSDLYSHKQIAAGCLIIPALWLALKVRSYLPRPGRPDRLPRLEN